jgi:hypothetical protein
MQYKSFTYMYLDTKNVLLFYGIILLFRYYIVYIFLILNFRPQMSWLIAVGAY